MYHLTWYYITFHFIRLSILNYIDVLHNDISNFITCKHIDIVHAYVTKSTKAFSGQCSYTKWSIPQLQTHTHIHDQKLALHFVQLGSKAINIHNNYHIRYIIYTRYIYVYVLCIPYTYISTIFHHTMVNNSQVQMFNFHMSTHHGFEKPRHL